VVELQAHIYKVGGSNPAATGLEGENATQGLEGKKLTQVKCGLDISDFFKERQKICNNCEHCYKTFYNKLDRMYLVNLSSLI
jgi:hypothetical protein